MTELTAAAITSIDIETAIQMYTREAAEIAGFKNIGTLKAGNRASFALLSGDILKVPSSEIDDIFVEATYMDGELVYKKS